MAGKHAAPGDAPSDGTPADIRVLSGHATAEELAAITVVVSAQLQEETERATVDERPATDAWSRSQRNIRIPLTPGPGRWRHPGR